MTPVMGNFIQSHYFVLPLLSFSIFPFSLAFAFVKDLRVLVVGEALKEGETAFALACGLALAKTFAFCGPSNEARRFVHVRAN